MSQIAQALAKAKERTGQTAAPFLAAGTSAPVIPGDRATASATALRQAKNRQRFWVLMVVVTLPLTALVVWYQLRATAIVDKDIPIPSLSLGSQTGRQEPLATPQATPVKPSEQPAPPPPKPAASPRAELNQAVANLSISAVIPGDPAKIMVGGRVIRAGEALDGGLTFVGISDGLLNFTDPAGAIYTRRY